MSLIIERFEGTYAVCETEDGGFIQIKIDILPDGVKEGDVLSLIDGDYLVDKEAGELRRKELTALFYELLEDDESQE